eukprot:g32063.t1
MYDAALESCKGTWAYPWSQWTRSMGLLQLTQGHLLRCNPFMLQATLRACQSNYEWRPSIALLRCLLGNALEAHSEQYSAALAVCAKAMQWTWGLHFLRAWGGTMFLSQDDATSVVSLGRTFVDAWWEVTLEDPRAGFDEALPLEEVLVALEVGGCEARVTLRCPMHR